MNRYRHIIIIAIAAICSVNAFAQKKFTEEDFSKLFQKALAAMEDKSYRQVSTVETFDDRNRPPRFKSTTTTTYMPPDAKHMISQVEDAGGVRKSETIYIGNKIYSRENDKEWKEEPSGGGSGNKFTVLGKADRPKIKRIVEYKGKEGDPSADLYIVTEKEKGYREAIYVKKYWFNDAQQLVREESESYYTNSNSLLRTSTTYEYDPDIKIKAPIQQ